MKKVQLSDLNPREIIPGFHGKLVHGEGLTMAFWEIEAGSPLPEHHHVHEQVAYVLSGEFEFTMDGKTFVAGPESVTVIPSNMPHSGRALTDCKILDVFQPVREDYRSEEDG